jgi:membrane AbrB-like protein
MFTSSLINIAGYYPKFPVWAVSFLSNMLIGIMLGRLVDRNVFRQILKLSRHVLFLSAGMLSLSLISGLALHALTDISISTALISGAAGGITEMIIYGMSVNADVAVIAFIQLFRVVTFLVLIPYISIISEKFKGRKRNIRTESNTDASSVLFKKKEYFVLILISCAGAIIGRLLEIPTGALIGAMIASRAYAITIGKKYRYDSRIRCFAQIALGLVMGERMTPQAVSQLGSLLMPAITVTGIMLIGSATLALFLYRSTNWDLVTCLLCAAPAGLSQITVYAEDIGADTFTASVFHTVRIISIVTLYPLITMPFIGIY